MSNPWDNDPIAQPAQPFGGRPVIQEHAPPKDPVSEALHQEQLRGERLLNQKREQDIKNASGAPAVAASNVSGDAYLKSLDPATSSMVKALSEGRKAFPSGAALRSPYWQEMLSHLSNYDPGFDEVNYTGRAATRRDFTSGKAANNIRALNTAIGHLGHLEEQIGGTASHDFTPLNAVENFGRRITGDAGPTNFDTTVSALAGELTAVYRGSGGAEADIQRYISQLSPNASHEQKVGAIRNIVGLLKSRLDALNDQYRQGMGTTAQQLQLLDPQAQLIVQHLGGFDAAGSPQDGPGGPMAPGGGPGGSPPPTMPSDRMVPATGQTKEIVDPNLTPVRREYMARLQAGQSGTELVGFLRKAGVSDPRLLQAAAQQAAFRRKNPNIPINQYDTSAIDHITEQMGLVNRGVNALGQSDVGAGMIAAGNQMLGGYGPEVVGALGGNPEQARLNAQYSAQDHPGAALTGSIVGGTAAALTGEAALARAGMGAGFGRSLLADTGYGALAGSGASPDNRIEGGLLGAGAGALGSVAGQAITRGGGAALRGVQDINVQKLVGSENPLTIGQAVGGKVKALEDKATSVPILGDMINARRAEGVRVFNSKAFDKALEPINATVQDQVGQEAVDKAHSLVADAFNQALRGKSVLPDQEFVTSARGPLQRLAMNKRIGPEIVNEIEGLTHGLFDEGTGALSGEHMQAFLDGLRQLRHGYKQDPLYSTLIKPSVQGLENAVEGMFKRQTPEVMPAFNKAKQAYRRLSILSDAVNAADNTGNVFTPAQLRRADLNNAKKYDGKINAAGGSGQFGDISGPAQAVLPSKVPNSGTTDRLALIAAPSLIAGSGAGIGYAAGDTRTGSEAGIGLASLLAALYTKGGQRILVNAAVKRGERTKAAGQALQRLAPVSGGAGATLSSPDQ